MTLVLFVLLLLLCCNSIDINPFVSREVKEGHRLAQVYCRSCHKLPDPGLLDQKTWALYVLPKMGNFLGFLHLPTGSYITSGKETIKLEDWKKIMAYYIAESPEAPPERSKNNIAATTPVFRVDTPAFTISNPATTLVLADSPGRGFFFGDGSKGKLYDLTKQYFVHDSFAVQQGIAGLHVDNQKRLWVLTMGVLHPSDERKGKLEITDPVTKLTHILLDSLQRPVHASYADLDADGKEDVVICEFGNLTGTLGWFENVNGTKYIKHILRSLPGAVHTQVYDFNQDGRPDIMALMAQGDEGIFIYYNQGNGSFREERILQLPPSYGSNYFELADFNADGHPDIIATNGDNGDYPPILKAYHGIRIYLNDGHNRFAEKVFLPVYGAGKAIAKDFDGDGDLDIASISYFPDFDHMPEEGFLYWENKGGFEFTPSSCKEVSAGRWLTMDAGDIDGDGDLDLILGNAFFPLGYVPDRLKKQWERYTPSILVLKNTTKK